MLNSDIPQPSEMARPPRRASRWRSQISVIVVATERLFRLGLAGLLSEDSRLDVIGVSDGEADLLELCQSTSVDVVLLDIQLSRSDAIDLVRLIASECPHTKTLVLTSNADWRVRPTMIAGAAGVLLKDTSPEAIRAAVVSVHLGDQVLCNEAARWVLGEEPSTHLTQRESDVLRMVAQGANNSEIAAAAEPWPEDGPQLRQSPVSQARLDQPRTNRHLSGPERHRTRAGSRADSAPARERVLGQQPMNERPLSLPASLREIWRRRAVGDGRRGALRARGCRLRTFQAPGIDSGCPGSAAAQRCLCIHVWRARERHTTPMR